MIFLIIARAVGVEDFGLFAKTYATASLLALLVDFGYPQRILRDLDEYQETHGGLPARIFHLKLLLTLAGCLLAALAYVLLAFPVLVFAVVWCGLLLLSFGQVAGVTLRGMELHGRDSTNMFIAAAIGASWSAFLLVRGDTELFHYACSFLLIGGTYAVLGFSACRSLIEFRGETITIKALMDELRRGVSYASDVFVVRSYGVVDVVILSIFVNPAGVGIYQLAQKLMQVALPTGQVATNVMLPRLAKAYRAGELHMGNLKGLATAFVAFGSVMVGVFLLTTFVVQNYFVGEEYAGVWLLVPAFCITLMARLVSVAPSMWLVAIGQQRIRLAMNTLNFAILVPLCAVMSWQYGAWGAAVATAACAASLLVFYSTAAWRKGNALLVTREAGEMP
ncbi:lipopolysaccharide biosynthesis protein [Qipengyuania flava]|uniref:lipopolysaccharide biosynthesis protein n=1 Tax=Qipengyuania flava TaxID=192812 RepID=UPI001C62900E|nr:oligosaccharide flippase family protein [Qipengyuania flava]QYJ06362.1 oligosaccharide flippase family protein [Qipengyuania flava]